MSGENSGATQSNSRAKRARANTESKWAIARSGAFERPALAAKPLGEVGQDAGDFGQLFFAQLHQAVVEVDRFQRLDEHGLARAARSVDDAGNGAALGSADRNHESFVAQGDVVFAGRFAAAAQNFLERFMNCIAALGEPGANAAELRRCIVGDLAIGMNGPADSGSQMLEVGQRRSALGKPRKFRGIVLERLLHVAGGLRERRDLQQFAAGQQGRGNFKAREPSLGIGQRPESQFGAAAQICHGLADEREFAIQRGGVLAGGERLDGAAPGRTGGESRDNLF